MCSVFRMYRYPAGSIRKAGESKTKTRLKRTICVVHLALFHNIFSKNKKKQKINENKKKCKTKTATNIK